MTPTNRKEAAQLGAKVFFTGRPCRNGHTADRYTSTGNCVACLREHREDYTRALQAARKPSADPTARLFAYRLHADDHAAALAYCQALDLQRGRNPQAAPALQPPAPPSWEYTDEMRAEIARRRAELIGQRPPPPDYLPPEFRNTVT